MKNPCTNCQYSFSYEKSEKKLGYVCSAEEVCTKIQDFEDWKQSRRKYQKGDTKIEDFNTLLNQDVVWFNSKPMTKSFFKQQKIATLEKWLQTGLFTCKKLNKEVNI